jgi:hypothetical protein
MTAEVHRGRWPVVAIAVLVALMLAAVMTWYIYSRVSEQRYEKCLRGLQPGADARLTCQHHLSPMG